MIVVFYFIGNMDDILLDYHHFYDYLMLANILLSVSTICF
jgi:hypothetical protein